MKLVAIEKVKDRWKGGGGVFSGVTADEKRYRFVAKPSVMPRHPIAGELWLIQGMIRNHPKHGQQVEIDWAKLEKPSGHMIVHAVSRSGIFPGIGKGTINDLWKRFGNELYDLLDNADSKKIAECIGDRLAGILIDGWKEYTKEQSTVSEVFKWLEKHGVPLRLAYELMTVYPNDLVQQLDENPYKILAFTDWHKADMLARSLGYGDECEERYFAAADAVNYNRIIENHTWTDCDIFVDGLKKLLGCTDEKARTAYDVALYKNAIMEIAEGVQGRGPGSMEALIAERIQSMLAGRYEASQLSLRARPDERFFSSFFKKYHEQYKLTLNQEQRQSVEMTLTKPFGLITGGAGVGKTTVLHAVVQASKQLNAELYLIAFTGRAARRMKEASGHPALTIDSFCGKIDDCIIDLSNGEPTIIVDEASMVDLAHMFSLCLRLEPGCKLIMVGDPGQLPPIGFGVVFHSLCAYSPIPKIELTEIHRQAAATGIPLIAKDIREGTVPEILQYEGIGAGVSFLDCPIDDVTGKLMDIVDELGGFENTQILSPLKRGKSGSQIINRLAHELEASGMPEYNGFAPGEPVIWLHNDYEMDLMNGSIGRVSTINGNLSVIWDPEGEKKIENTMDMDHAYCITVHKSQGSEFPRVVIPVFKSRLLDRTLLYTAVTRSKQQVVLVGDRRALNDAVKAKGNVSRRQTAMHIHLTKQRIEITPICTSVVGSIES